MTKYFEYINIFVTSLGILGLRLQSRSPGLIEDANRTVYPHRLINDFLFTVWKVVTINKNSRLGLASFQMDRYLCENAPNM